MQLEGVRVFIIGSHFSSRWSWDGFKIWMLLYMLRFQCSAEFTNLASSLYCQPDTWGRLQSILVQYIDLGELLKGQLENRNCNLKRVNLLQILIPQQSSKEVSVQQFTKTLPGQSSKLQLFFSSCFFFFCWLCCLHQLWFHPPVVPPFRGWCFGLLPEGKVVHATAMSDPQVDRKNLKPRRFDQQNFPILNGVGEKLLEKLLLWKKTRGVFGGGIIVSTCK